MEFVETRDPLGFVGTRVMRHSRKARRRQRITPSSSAAMKPDPGVYDGDAEPDTPPTLVLYGWLTRYNTRLDVYTLYLPDGAGTILYPRAEVLKFVSNPEFQLRPDADEAFPPPLEDTTSRFVGTPMLKTSKRLQKEIPGRVVCYRPFADRYRVVYDDGSTNEVSESEIVDALLAFVKQHQTITTAPSTTTRKRRRSVELTNADDEETEDEDFKMEVMAEPQPKEPTVNVPEPSPPTTMAATAEGDNGFDFSTLNDDEPMELVPMDDDDEDDDMNSINAGLASIQTTTSLPPTTEVIELMDEPEAVTEPPPPVLSVPVPVPTGPRPVSYVVDVKPHVATQALDKRPMAFEFLRTELAKLLDAEECAKLETALVGDVMTNRDIKDRDAIRRFVETGGLVVINCVLNARARDALAGHDVGYDRVLFVLKLLAMLPTPSEQQVMESSIGKTIGRLSKSRMHDQQTSRDPGMPKCIAQLARWIKLKWLATMEREKKSTPTVAPKKHMQRPTHGHGRPSGQRSHDPEPIPRRQMTTVPVRPPQIPSFAASKKQSRMTTDVLGNALASATSPRWQQQKSSLKPDWMRQKETLTRTRFTINTDANAERQHYQRDRMNAEAANGPGAPNARRTEDAGVRGVYGRKQRLSFGPRWNVCEFFKDTPPAAVRRSKTNGSVHYRNMSARPKSILRKTSKYGDQLMF